MRHVLPDLFSFLLLFLLSGIPDLIHELLKNINFSLSLESSILFDSRIVEDL